MTPWKSSSRARSILHSYAHVVHTRTAARVKSISVPPRFVKENGAGRAARATNEISREYTNQPAQFPRSSRAAHHRCQRDCSVSLRDVAVISSDQRADHCATRGTGATSDADCWLLGNELAEDIVLLGIGKAELNLVADMLGLSDNCDSASVTDRDGGAVIFVTLTD